MKVNTLTLGSSDYPQQLSELSDAPQKIYTIGNVSLLSSPHILSVVGSRKVSAYGRQATTDLVEAVAAQGIVIVSGLALGVDSVAHQATLAVGGKTIAVMPCGLDSIYPSSHRNLAMRILENNGLLISEYDLGTPPMKHHFIARNRIVSVLAHGLLITEASRMSGTIHTANFALEQGRTVMAVPGNITSPGSEGTNNLIRTGASPITSADDIYEALNIIPDGHQTEIFAASAEEAAILSLMQQGITDSTELLTASNLDSATFNQTLTMLEITHKIRPLGGGHWAI